MDGRFAGGPSTGCRPSACSAASACWITYAALGCGWLILKTDADLQRRMRLLMRPLACALLGAMALVSLWTVMGLPAVAQRWFGGSGNLGWFLPVPILMLACVWGIFRSVRLRHEAMPFLLTLALCFLGYTGWSSASAEHRAAVADDLAGSVQSFQPVVRAGRHRDRAADHPMVYNALQYRVPRQVREGDAGFDFRRRRRGPVRPDGMLS